MSLRKFIGDGVRSVIGSKLYVRLRMGFQAEHSYLRKVRGVIHVGANQGQERHLYAAFGLNVIWIEPIPEVFRILKRNISELPKQSALNYLVTDDDGREYQFHIANNAGASSSIFNFSKHREIWPEIAYTNTVTLKSATLKGILDVERVDIRQFDALVLDTQGSEYKVLMGAVKILPNFKFVKVEVPDFDSYEGCCQIGELSAFMLSNGFREQNRIPFMHVPQVGTYFDILYRRVRVVTPHTKCEGES